MGMLKHPRAERSEELKALRAMAQARLHEENFHLVSAERAQLHRLVSRGRLAGTGHLCDHGGAIELRRRGACTLEWFSGRYTMVELGTSTFLAAGLPAPRWKFIIITSLRIQRAVMPTPGNVPSMEASTMDKSLANGRRCMMDGW